MKTKIFILCAAAAFACASGCSTTKKVSKDAAEPTGQYVDADLVDRYWKLLDLYGSPVKGNAKEAHIIFNGADGRFGGNAGCNSFSGTFTTQAGYRIELSQAVATKMMCLDMRTETGFLEVLSRVDSYAVQGDTLTLIRARMAPLATFVAVDKQ